MGRYLGRGNIESDANNLRVYMAEGNSDGSNSGPLIFANPTATQGLGLWIKHTTQPYQVDVDDGEVLSLVHFDLEATGDATAGLLYGLHIETAAATVDKSAGIALINKGHADSIYIKLAGESGNPADNSPTGIGMDLNQANDGTTNEGSSSNGGHQGLQIYDWSTTDQGVGGPRAVFLNKIGNMDTDHQLLNLRGNRRNLEIITNSASGSYDGSQPVLRLADEDTGNDLAVLTAAGNLTLGTADTGPINTLIIAGGGSGVTEGATIYLQMSADYDGSFDAWRIGVNTNLLRFQTDTTTRLSITQSGLTTIHGSLQVNQDLDVDGDATFNANVGVGIDGASASDLLHVYDGGLKVEGTGYLGVTGGTLTLQSNEGTPANDVVGGLLRSLAPNSLGNPIIIGDIYFQITDITAGAENSAVRIVTQTGGADAFVFNAVEDRVGINELDPAEALDVTGNIVATGSITGFSLRGTDSIQLDNQKVLGFLNAAASAYLFTISTTAGDDLFFYDQGTPNDFIFRRTLAASAIDLTWGQNASNEGLLSLGAGTQGTRLTIGSKISIQASGSGGGTTQILVGENDVTRGLLYLYGAGAGQTQGGALRLYISADHDTTYQYWQMDVSQDTLRFLTDGTERAYVTPTGDLIANDDLYAFGGDVLVGVDDSVAGQLTCYGPASGTDGGQILLHFSGAHDATYEWYRIDAYEDDLRFGREGETAVAFAGATGPVATFGNGTGDASVLIDGAAGNVRQVVFMSGGSNRAILRLDGTAESGSNAGSNVILNMRDDSGNHLNNAISIQRSDGAVQIGSPTGGFKGAGTLNAQGVYDDNVLLTDWLFDLYYDGRMQPHDQEKHPDARLWSLFETAVFTMENRHLPTMPGREEWEAAGSKSVGELVTALWETVEQQQIQMFEQHKVIDGLAARLTAVEASLSS